MAQSSSCLAREGLDEADDRVASLRSAIPRADRNPLCRSGEGGNGMAPEDVIAEIRRLAPLRPGSEPEHAQRARQRSAA